MSCFRLEILCFNIMDLVQYTTIFTKLYLVPKELADDSAGRHLLLRSAGRIATVLQLVGLTLQRPASVKWLSYNAVQQERMRPYIYLK